MSEHRGEQIPNSRYYRDFCYLCQEPIRVSFSDLERQNRCDNCYPMTGAPGAHTGLCKRQKAKLSKTTG